MTENLLKKIDEYLDEEDVHDNRQSQLYNTWLNMKKRCEYKNSKDWKNYGGRGIKMCKEWKDKENGFKNFAEWAKKNGYKKGMSIDRIDPNKGYNPDNCRWISDSNKGEKR